MERLPTELSARTECNNNGQRERVAFTAVNQASVRTISCWQRLADYFACEYLRPVFA
jgi:hypothetical protein